MWNISIVFICSLNKAIVDKVLHRKKWCWSDSIAQILFLQQQNLVADIVKQCYPKPPIPAVFLHDVTLFVAFYIRPLFVNLGQSRSFVIIFNISGLVNIFKRFGWESFCYFIYWTTAEDNKTENKIVSFVRAGRLKVSPQNYFNITDFWSSEARPEAQMMAMCLLSSYISYDQH